MAGVEEKPAKNTSEESPKRSATKTSSSSASDDPSEAKPKRSKKNVTSSPNEKELKFVVYSAGEGEPVETSNFKVTEPASSPSKAAISSILNEESITPTLDSADQ